MADKTWKRVEREACRELGGDRRGPTGRDTVDCNDAVQIGLEIKSYKRFVWLTKDWEQAVRNAMKAGLPPALFVREGGRNGRRRVQMYYGDMKLLCHRSGLCPARHLLEEVEGHIRRVVRMDWPVFVALYTGAYPTEGDHTV